jgi:RimJ/RimL family protein N-acetyltransferase
MTRSPNPPLQHGEVFLRNWHVGDIRALVAACADDEIARWTPVPSDYDEAAAAAYIERADALWGSGRGAAFAIVGAATGELLGAVELRLRAGARGTIGFWLEPDARGRGIATRAVRLVADWALRELGVQRIEVATDPRNEPSHRVVERAGFVRAALRRRAIKLKGERRNSVIFARTREA